MSVPKSKDELRAVFPAPSKKEITEVQGRLAEKIRRIPGYREFQQIFIGPTPLLQQARINALLDKKELIMPAAGLKDGFYLLKPFTIPFKKLNVGVTYKGLAGYGRKILPDDIKSLEISLLIGESQVADGDGWSLGNGEGFFDLAVALLKEMGGLKDGCRLVSTLADAANLIEKVPHDPWDVRCDMILSPDKMIELADPAVLPDIEWGALSPDRIKRITPLWKMNGTKK